MRPLAAVVGALCAAAVASFVVDRLRLWGES